VAYRARQCLVQLSGIHGPILGDDDDTIRSYAALMLQGYGKLIVM
jgi:hypothetical protein